MDYSRPELADRLAADYVSGTLRGAARRRLESLLPAHPVLRDAVHEWQDRLAPLSTSINPQPPPDEVWHGIEARIGARPAPTRRRRWWQGLLFWRGVAAFASLAALSALLLPLAPASLPPIIVVLDATAPAAGSGAGAATPASFVASISGDGRAVVTRPLVKVALQPDRALELWALPASGEPTSLGLIAADAASVVQRDRRLDGAVGLAVSLEPPGGSPTGAPTGPVLYAGKFSP